MAKADSAFARQISLFDTTIGWRFVNPLMAAQYGVDSMPETAENAARDYRISRADQDRFAMASQAKTAAAQQNGVLAQEIVPVQLPQKKSEALSAAQVSVTQDKQLRATSIEALCTMCIGVGQGIALIIERV